MGSSILWFTFFAGSLTSLAYAKKPATDNLARDLAVLQAFEKTITSDPTGNISKTYKGKDVCNFAGVNCDTAPGGYKAVVGIDYNQYDLKANLRVDGLLDQLLDLSIFHVNSNGFLGTVPEISHLKYLTEIDFSNNKLSGPFPTTVLQQQIYYLDIRFNSFTGPLPAELFATLTDLDVLFLNGNQFSGPLPEWGKQKISFITLSGNKFTGTIPGSWAKNTALTEFQLGNNQFTGTIPEELCALKIEVFNVTGNPLSGTLGPNCAKLYKKKVLHIEGTALKVDT